MGSAVGDIEDVGVGEKSAIGFGLREERKRPLAFQREDRYRPGGF
jgi:hypothetical protein